MLQNLRQAMHRQLRQHSARCGNPSLSRRLPPLWTRAFPSGRPTAGPDLHPPGSAQPARGLQRYQSVGAEGHQCGPCSGAGAGDAGALPECFAMVDLRYCSPERAASPPSSPPEMEPSRVGRASSRAWSRSASHSEPPVRPLPSVPPRTIRNAYRMCRNRTSHKLVLELAGNLRGVSLMRYSSLGPVSPLSPQSQTSTSSFPSQGPEGTSSPEASSSVTGEDNNHQVTVEMRGRDGRRRERRSQSRVGRFSSTFNDEEGDPGTETTPC